MSRRLNREQCCSRCRYEADWIGTLANQYGAWANIYRNGTAVGPARFPPVAAYHKDGHFPDGTVLVKEVFKTTTNNMTTGTVSSAGTLAGWFVMVKDSQDSYQGNPLWGDGWGWAWFDAKNRMKTTSTDYKKDCLACHVPAQATDWVYTSGYPPLK
ncbi:MAG: cytochrome P460 family protein [Xanthobacteraceae bacterium]